MNKNPSSLDEKSKDQSNNQDKSNTKSDSIALVSKELWVPSIRSLELAYYILAMAELASSALISIITTTTN